MLDYFDKRTLPTRLNSGLPTPIQAPWRFSVSLWKRHRTENGLRRRMFPLGRTCRHEAFRAFPCLGFRLGRFTGHALVIGLRRKEPAWHKTESRKLSKPVE